MDTGSVPTGIQTRFVRSLRSIKVARAWLEMCCLASIPDVGFVPLLMPPRLERGVISLLNPIEKSPGLFQVLDVLCLLEHNFFGLPKTELSDVEHSCNRRTHSVFALILFLLTGLSDFADIKLWFVELALLHKKLDQWLGAYKPSAPETTSDRTCMEGNLP